MKINNIKSLHKNKKTKRIARGSAGKGGHTGGRGNKGQKARTGFNIPIGFEGGQSKLFRRIPKVGGFKSLKVKNYIIKSHLINDNFKENDVVSIKKLIDKKIIFPKLLKNQEVKILFDKPFDKKFTFSKEIKLSKKLLSK